MAADNQFTIELTQLDGLEFKVKFDLEKLAEMRIGGDASPGAARLVAAAAANCLGASLLYCVAKNDPPAGSLKARVTCNLVRNDKGRTRIGSLAVTLEVNGELEQAVRLQGCLGLYEQFSLAAQSLRQGFPVDVQVVNQRGETLHQSKHQE